MLYPFILFISYLIIKRLYKTYMSFQLDNYYDFSEKKDFYKLSEMIKGKSKIELNNVVLRVVAANVEI